jgi:hypothetical protein
MNIAVVTGTASQPNALTRALEAAAQNTLVLKEVPAARKLTVKLDHAPNPDIRSGGYWEDVPPAGAKIVEVKSLAEASNVCQDFIEKYGLGGGNWTGGEVRADGIVIAQISYNGRCWTPAPWGSPDHKEITI